MDNAKQRAIKATEILLKRKGYEVVSTGWSCPDGEIGAIALDGDCVVFLEVAVGQDEFPEPEAPRSLRESLAVKWLSTEGCEISDAPVRFDNISFIVVNDTKALVRHHINALSEACAFRNAGASLAKQSLDVKAPDRRHGQIMGKTLCYCLD